MRWLDLEHRKVAIIGFGREGQAAYRQLRRRYPQAQIGIFDEGNMPEPPDDRCDLHLGPLDAPTLCQYDVALRSPGVSPYREALSAARRQGLEVVSPGSLWFAEHPGARTICITGTKGKSTTAALTAHLLRACGKSVVLAGNIGRPLLDCEEQEVDWWVIEQSSYQLADLQANPEIAAILNVSDEHLDWHAGRANYLQDKLRLAELAAGQPLVLNWKDESLRSLESGAVKWFEHPDGWHVRENFLWHGPSRITDAAGSGLSGAHNLANLAAALTLVECAGLRVADLDAALDDFQPLPHRLEKVGVTEGVSFVNDSLSTTPVATLAALQAYRDSRVILLAGGLDRGLDWSDAAVRIAAFEPRAVICLPDNGPLIAKAMQAAGFSPELGTHCVSGLEEAMRKAASLAGPGDVVLLSPGAPSFPHFRDFADRGDQFARLAGVY
ncbi:MAG: UDP-N-acetylmuramoyl-L-alanine--D-glutamate ligase [Xanthomonadales bacterium]|nr:UDP-N-acetylmuramoyl-L-alanine--D-glutamate ligase [Xanthomonadales bacterium]